jgi:hypothetical protein
MHNAAVASREARPSRFLMELDPAQEGFDDIQAVSARSRAACEEMSVESMPIRLVRCLFVPEDGSCFLLFEAVSVNAVEEAVRRAVVPRGPVWELQRS